MIILQEQLNIALAKRYTVSSEKLSLDQICLFDEEAATPEQEVTEEDDTVSVPVHPAINAGPQGINGESAPG